MKILEDVDLSQFSFMKIGGKAKFLVQIEKDSEMKELKIFQEKHKLPILFIGEGSNSIFSNNYHQKIFVQIKTKDVFKLYENDRVVSLKVSAGFNWDKFVELTVSNNLAGIEKLSAIPGTVGASPIQNIGAYGQEVSNVVSHVDVYEFETGKFYEIPNGECQFAYRQSLFKKIQGQVAVLNVAFILSKGEPEYPSYKDLALYFLEKQNKRPTLSEIREAVVSIRKNKLPDWQKEPNCGSFFTNPIVTNDQIAILNQKYPNIPQFKAEDGFTKVSGGWLIEQCGFKGKTIEKIKIHDKNALILINTGKATFSNLEKAIQIIKEKVKEKFEINLEVEPNLIK